MKGLKEIAADIFLAWLILAVTMPNWIKAAEAVKTFAEVWENTRKNIQAMSEEDYKKFLQYLAPEEKGWAEIIRMGGGKA